VAMEEVKSQSTSRYQRQMGQRLQEAGLQPPRIAPARRDICYFVWSIKHDCEDRSRGISVSGRLVSRP
jgi:hypothetical protein